MTTREISLDSIVSSLLGVMPDWNEEQQSLAIHLYRILAQGSLGRETRLTLRLGSEQVAHGRAEIASDW